MLHCQGYEEGVNTADEGGGAPPHTDYGASETAGTPKGKEGCEKMLEPAKEPLPMREIPRVTRRALKRKKKPTTKAASKTVPATSRTQEKKPYHYQP